MKNFLATILLITVIASGCTTTGIQTENREQKTNSTVTEVVDGDTLDLQLGDTKETIRLLGVDTPEVHVENNPRDFENIPDSPRGRECLRKWGEKASNYAKKELSGQKVVFQTDPKSDVRGGYGRLLGYIKKDGKNFNYKLVKKGYARVYTSGFTQQKRFLEAENNAQKKLRGLWQCRTYEIGNITVEEE